MSSTVGHQTEVIAKAHVPEAEDQGTAKEMLAGKGSMDASKHVQLPPYGSTTQGDDEYYDDTPTEEELATLRRVSGQIKWSVYTIAFAELCERFSYYGSAVLYTNFVMRPLPDGSNTGANPNPQKSAGALGMGQKAAQGISLFNQFFAYFMPLIG
jgi:proton-dependent oligopeptide transporter, POT family